MPRKGATQVLLSLVLTANGDRCLSRRCELTDSHKPYSHEPYDCAELLRAVFSNGFAPRRGCGLRQSRRASLQVAAFGRTQPLQAEHCSSALKLSQGGRVKRCSLAASDSPCFYSAAGAGVRPERQQHRRSRQGLLRRRSARSDRRSGQPRADREGADRRDRRRGPVKVVGLVPGAYSVTFTLTGFNT